MPDSPANDQAADEAGFSPAGMRVLVVDDDKLCLKVIAKMLTQCNYEGVYFLLSLYHRRKAAAFHWKALSFLSPNYGGYTPCTMLSTAPPLPHHECTQWGLWESTETLKMKEVALDPRSIRVP